jgi:hypothetical protein
VEPSSPSYFEIVVPNDIIDGRPRLVLKLKLLVVRPNHGVPIAVTDGFVVSGLIRQLPINSSFRFFIFQSEIRILELKVIVKHKCYHV